MTDSFLDAKRKYHLCLMLCVISLFSFGTFLSICLVYFLPPLSCNFLEHLGLEAPPGEDMAGKGSFPLFPSPSNLHHAVSPVLCKTFANTASSPSVHLDCLPSVKKF